jgi:Transposase
MVSNRWACVSSSTTRRHRAGSARPTTSSPPGRTVYHASGGYRGDGKTDAKDAAIIADQARMRRDLQPLRLGDDIAVELRILTGRRTDLVADRTRAINRLRAQLLEYFPALERAFDFSASKAALMLLTGYQTPDGLRRVGTARLAAWLRKRKARNASGVAAAAIEAANAQHTIVPGQHLAATVVARLAKEVIPHLTPRRLDNVIENPYCHDVMCAEVDGGIDDSMIDLTQ